MVKSINIMFVVGVLILGIAHAGFNSNIKSKFGM